MGRLGNALHRQRCAKFAVAETIANVASTNQNNQSLRTDSSNLHVILSRRDSASSAIGPKQYLAVMTSICKNTGFEHCRLCLIIPPRLGLNISHSRSPPWFCHCISAKLLTTVVNGDKLNLRALSILKKKKTQSCVSDLLKLVSKVNYLGTAAYTRGHCRRKRSPSSRPMAVSGICDSSRKFIL